VALAAKLNPDVVLMDIGMPELNGLDATRQIVELGNSSRIIAVSMHRERQYVQGILKAGASGYLLKDSACEELIQAVCTVAEGHVYLSPRIGASVIEGLRVGKGDDDSKSLTTREREVLQGVSEGASTKQIALNLGVSGKTVETHRRALMKKLDLYSVAELTKYAIRHGLTALE
jgi:DNA-binding NarL/FixJ family response regulator